MKNVCSLELNDKVKIIIDNEPLMLSENIYTVVGIIALHKAITGIADFRIILKDEFGKDLPPKKIEYIQLAEMVESPPLI